MQPLLKVEGLKKYYPIRKGFFASRKRYVKAVDHISFQVFPGETLGIVGESGSGKSTLGRTVIRLEEPTEGRILFNSQDISRSTMAELRGLRKEMQIIFQDPYSSLNPRKRIGELLAEPMQVHFSLDHSTAKQKVNDLLEIVGLSQQHRNRYPHEFSGGQRQRIGIARALTLQPKLIVCDEPVSALDVSIQSQILNLLKELQGEFQLTYLFIAHGLAAVKYVSDRIAVMYLGQIVELAPAQEIFTRPRHPYTQALLDAYPAADPMIRNRERIVLEGDIPSPANPPQGCRFHTRCPFVQTRCKEETPVLHGEDHLVACHFRLS